MTKSDEQLVRESWALVCSKFTFEQVGELFYATLFEANPTLPDTIFKGVDIPKQSLKLIQMIDSAVKMLDQPSALVPALIELGERHGAYGTVEAHFAPVGAALLATLGKGLGDKFDAPTKQAWVNVYGVISAKMIEGLNSPKGKELYAQYVAKHGGGKCCACSPACVAVTVVGIAVVAFVAMKFLNKK